MMMCQCRFIQCNKCTPLVGGADTWLCMCGLWEISVPSSQHCCEPQTALQNKVYWETMFKGSSLLIS